MTPQAFTAKWHDNPLPERDGAQSQFLGLGEMLALDLDRAVRD